MSAQTGSTPTDGPASPADPEAVIDETAEPQGEDYDPQDDVDPDREAAEADMIEQIAEAPQDEDEVAESGDDLA